MLVNGLLNLLNRSLVEVLQLIVVFLLVELLCGQGDEVDPVLGRLFLLAIENADVS